MKNVILLLLLLMPIELLAQSKEYVILTFSAKRKGVDKHYIDHTWIIPFDSIKTGNNSHFSIYPLIVDELERYGEDEHCFDDVTYRSLIRLYQNDYKDSFSANVIRKYRKLIQSIKIEWEKMKVNGKKCSIKIKVYATPVKGYFCNCVHAGDSSIIYYTSDKLEYWSDFWNTSRANNIRASMYSHIEYDLWRKVRQATLPVPSDFPIHPDISSGYLNVRSFKSPQ